MGEDTEPTSFGRVADDGTVFVRTADGEAVVGQWAAGSPEDGLKFFALKYEDLKAEVDLAIRRLPDGKATPESALALVERVRAAIETPSMVGDLAGLSAKASELEGLVAERRKAIAAEKQAAREAALAARTRLVTEAESLAESTQWKATGERFKTLLEEWKAAPRGDRGREQELWKRFSHARSTFDKHRRSHFARLDAERSQAKSVKESLIGEAEALSTSTDWNTTARAYRDLMTQWKAAPRGSKSDEDALWARFKTAQDTFFAARSETLTARDAGLKDNAVIKEALLVEAEALLPIRDLKTAKASLRSIQERWEKAGHVPRSDKDRLDGRLRKVEDAIRHAEEDSWRRSNPELRARAEQTVEQFRGSVAKLERQRDKAVADGDARAVDAAVQSLESTRVLLEAAEKGLAEYSG